MDGIPTDDRYAVASLAEAVSTAYDDPLFCGEGELGENHTDLLGNLKKAYLASLSDYSRS